MALPPPPANPGATPAPLGRWFDGRKAQGLAVRLARDSSHLLLWPLQPPLPAEPAGRYPLQALTWPEPTRHGVYQLILPDGGVLRLDDAPTWDRWARAHHLRTPLAARWAQSWRSSALAGVLLVALMAGAWRWAIPWAAQHAAQAMPDTVRQTIDREVVAEFTRRGWLQPSALPAEQQQQVRDALAQALARAYAAAPAGPQPPGAQAPTRPPASSPLPPLPRHRLSFHRMPKALGPNAFALPGGQIVVNDALVALLRATPPATVHPALLGVLAHELGHVQGQHGLQLVAQAGAMGVLMGWWVGDHSAVLAGVPTVLAQAGYSRTHERAADAEALRVMQAAGLDPTAMAEFFRRLAKALPERDGDSLSLGLSSHPADQERIAFFERAGQRPRP